MEGLRAGAQRPGSAGGEGRKHSWRSEKSLPLPLQASVKYRESPTLHNNGKETASWRVLGPTQKSSTTTIPRFCCHTAYPHPAPAPRLQGTCTPLSPSPWTNYQILGLLSRLCPTESQVLTAHSMPVETAIQKGSASPGWLQICFIYTSFTKMSPPDCSRGNRSTTLLVCMCSQAKSQGAK